jgi:hypothetical protein
MSPPRTQPLDAASACRAPRRGFYACAVLAVALLSGVGGARLVLAWGGAPPAALWQRPAFFGAWLAERACLLAFQCAAARAAALSLRAPEEPWLAAAEAGALRQPG